MVKIKQVILYSSQVAHIYYFKNSHLNEMANYKDILSAFLV